MNEDQEILTPTGWKKISTITCKDDIATFNIYTEKVEWRNPTHIIKSQYDGNLIHITNYHIDMMCVPTQSLFTRDDTEYDDFSYTHFSLKDASNILGKSQIFKKDGENTRSDIATFELPRLVYPISTNHRNIEYTTLLLNMNTWLEFLGIYLAFGSQSAIHPFIRIDTQKIHVINKLLSFQSILNVLLEYSEKNKAYFIHSIRLYDYVTSFGDLKNRIMPDWALNLSTTQSQILINSLLFNTKNHGMITNASYNTYSKTMADQVQILAFNAEYSANITNTKNIYRVEISDNTLTTEPVANACNQTVVQHIGDIYNIKVVNGVYMTRRNNKYCWIG